MDFAHQVTYSEKLNVGYRWYTTYGVTPVFPFGHGLSVSDSACPRPAVLLANNPAFS